MKQTEMPRLALRWLSVREQRSLRDQRYLVTRDVTVTECYIVKAESLPTDAVHDACMTPLRKRGEGESQRVERMRPLETPSKLKRALYLCDGAPPGNIIL